MKHPEAAKQHTSFKGRFVHFLLAPTLFTSLVPNRMPAQDASQQTKPTWHYGGFADVGYLVDFNHPANHLFRNRSTTPRVDELDLNMAAIYLTKDASEKSRWGMELEAQAGEDSKIFGFSATAPNLAGANWLRQIGKADVSYLAPVGKGLTVQGGIFSSLIGYDSLYAKDNFNYRRRLHALFDDRRERQLSVLQKTYGNGVCRQ
jgi:Putative beta-barrel porin-2, OmpL-like. bbp2